MKVLSQCTVLIVDDTETNIDILVDVLGNDYELSVAMDGETALEIMHREKPDLVLLDINMPGLSGYDVCSAMKSDPSMADIPVIFLTALTDIGSKSKGFELGAVDYITKPFEALEVRARVNTHLALALARKELSIQNDILEKRVDERTREISLTQETTIEALACLAEYRDPETGGHIKRTKNYIKALAERLCENSKYSGQLKGHDIDLLYKSAPLHDIGKIGVRDDILLKQGPLSDNEFEEMKMHTVIGYSALRMASLKLGESSFLKYAMEFTKSHQERWDGTGYPESLSGEAIPLSARMMAVSDVYDALISKRVYKPPLSHQEAIDIIMSLRGSQFDPEIVDAFLDINEDFRKIAMQYADYSEEYLALSIKASGHSKR
ncbi:MAG: response regulator [Clostridiales bacterium]|nr:response regulator [Clostridiales bacterium]